MYHDRIIEHYEDPYHCGECGSATHLAQRDTRQGSVLISLRVNGNQVVSEAWFESDGPPPLAAAASMICEFVEGKGSSELLSQESSLILDALSLGGVPEIGESMHEVWATLHDALRSPVDEDSDAYFQGPHLGDEC